MISERTFANEFSGFWAETLPFLTPQAIASINLRGATIGDGGREWVKALPTAGNSSNNDVVAETAFGIFAESIFHRAAVSEICKDNASVRAIAAGAMQRIFGLRRDDPGRINVPPSSSEAVALAKRLETYFKPYSLDTLIIQPRFRGCGILDSCQGDILAARNLCELKMVDRNLRSADVRQLLTYCALNYRSAQYAIDSVTILNPRRGLAFVFDIEELADFVCGTNSSELFHRITTFLADFETVHHPS